MIALYLLLILILQIALIIFFVSKRRLQTKGKINNQSALYESIINSSDDAIITKDLQGIITSWNQGAENLFNYTADEIMGKHISLLIPSQRVNEEAEIIEKIKINQTIKHYDTERVRKDGSIINISLTVSPLKDFKGQIIGVSKIARDITQQSAHEEALQRSLKDLSDYKYALDESAIVAITDHHGVIKHVNNNFCKISGYSSVELIGQDHRIINSGYHTKAFIRDLWVTIAHGKIWKGELMNRAKDGTNYWVDTTIVPFLNAQGKPYQYVAIRSDITQRKKSEQIERLNEELNEKIKTKSEELVEVFERITDGFIVLDKDFRYTYVNKRTGEMVGRDPQSLIGKMVWDEFPDAINSGTFHAFKKAMDEQCYIYNIDYYAPLNLWQENHIYPSKDGLSVFIRDVSEQRMAHEKIKYSEKIYKTIASSIPGSVICLIDKDYKYLLIEGDMLEAMGYEKEQLLGNRVQTVISTDRFTDIEPHLQRVFTGESFTVENYRSGFDILSRFVPLRDESNNVFAAMIVIFDVSELKKAQRVIAELNVDLENKVKERTLELIAVNKELEAFSYSVAHDLRTPLRAVHGYAKMLDEDYGNQLDNEGKRLIEQIGSNAMRMGTLIDDLLTFSRLGRKEIQKSLIDMRDLVGSAINALNLPADHVVEIEFNNLHSVMADPSLMRNVMINLLSNAVKYSSKINTPRIKVTSKQDDNSITYCVSDNGVGFDMDYADKLFGVFQRLHADTEFDGTGVGLAIVQRVIHRHNGKVWAKSKVNEGAKFYFSLPSC